MNKRATEYNLNKEQFARLKELYVETIAKIKSQQTSTIMGGKIV